MSISATEGNKAQGGDTNIRAEINRERKKINRSKRCFLDKINNIDKPLAKLTKKNREKTQIQSKRKEETLKLIKQKYNSS